MRMTHELLSLGEQIADVHNARLFLFCSFTALQLATSPVSLAMKLGSLHGLPFWSSYVATSLIFLEMSLVSARYSSS